MVRFIDCPIGVWSVVGSTCGRQPRRQTRRGKPVSATLELYIHVKWTYRAHRSARRAGLPQSISGLVPCGKFSHDLFDCRTPSLIDLPHRKINETLTASTTETHANIPARKQTATRTCLQHLEAVKCLQPNIYDRKVAFAHCYREYFSYRLNV